MAAFPSQFFPVPPSSRSLWPLHMSGCCCALVRQDMCAVSCSWAVTFHPGTGFDVTWSRTFPGFFHRRCQSCSELGVGGMCSPQARPWNANPEDDKAGKTLQRGLAGNRGGNVPVEVTGGIPTSG